jgi:hypothetical protein
MSWDGEEVPEEENWGEEEENWGEEAWSNWVDPNADPWAYLIDDAYLLDDDPAPPTANQLWEIGGREDTKLEADPKEYIMTILEHDMDEVKEGGFPGLRAYIRLACKWDGAAAIPYAKKSFKALLDKTRNLADKTLRVGDKKKLLSCLLRNMQNAKRKYPEDGDGSGLGMMWEMLTTVLMREASSYTEPDPEEYVLVPEQYGAAGEGAEQCGEWPFLHDGNSTLAPAVVKRLINPNDSGWYKVAKWVLEQAPKHTTDKWKVSDQVKDGCPLCWLPLHLSFISTDNAEEPSGDPPTLKRRHEFPSSISNLDPSGALSSVDDRIAIAKLMRATILLRPTPNTHPDRQGGLLSGADFDKADIKELISRLPGLMLVNKQISAGAAAGSDDLIASGTAIDRYQKRMRLGPWMTQLKADIAKQTFQTNKDIAASLNIMGEGTHELAFQTPELKHNHEVSVNDLLMMSHLSTLIIAEDVHYTAIPKFKPRKPLPQLKPLHTTSEYGDWKKLQDESLWDSSNMIRALLRGRIKPKRRMGGMGFGGMDEDEDMAMAMAASMGHSVRGGKGGKEKEPGVSPLVSCTHFPAEVFAKIMLHYVVEYEDGQDQLELKVGQDRQAGGMTNFSMPGGRRGGKRGGKKGRRGRGGMMGGMGGMGFDMGYEGEGGEPGGGEGVFSGYVLEWENTSDQTEADRKSKKAPPMTTIEDTPLRGPVTGEEVAEAAAKELVAMPPCRAGKVIHSNPWRWPNLWDEDDESTQYQYYLFGASMMNYGADHGQQLNGSGMAGLSGAARGIAHFRYIGIPVNPEGFSDDDFQQAVAAQFAKAHALVLAGNDVHVPEHWVHNLGFAKESKRGGMMGMMGGMGGGMGGGRPTVVYTLEKHGSCGLVAPVSLGDAGRIHVSDIMARNITQLEAVARARAEQAYDATVHETLLQMHDSLWRERWNCVSTGGFDFANVGAASVAETEKVADNMKVWLKHLASLRAAFANLMPAWDTPGLSRDGRTADLERQQDHLELNLELGLLAFRQIHALTHHAQTKAANDRDSLKGDARACRDLSLLLLADADALLGGMIGGFVQNFPAFQAQFSTEFEKAPAQFEFLMKSTIRSFFLAGAHTEPDLGHMKPTSDWVKTAFQAQASRFRKAEGVMIGEANPVVAKAGGVKLNKLDAETADPGTWLTGDIMNFWMAVLEEEAKEKKTKCPYLIQATAASSIASEHTQLDSLGYMDAEFLDAECVVVPVSDSDGKSSGEHWSSLIYHKESNGLYVMDSMGIGDTANDAAKKYANKFQAYLTDKGREGATINVIKIPKQGNLADCGVYTCAIAYIAAQGDLSIFFDPAKIKSELSGGNIAGMRARMKSAVQEYGGHMKGKEFIYDGATAAGAAPEAPEEQANAAKVDELQFLIPGLATNQCEGFLAQKDIKGSVEKVVRGILNHQQQKKGSMMSNFGF